MCVEGSGCLKWIHFGQQQRCELLVVAILNGLFRTKDDSFMIYLFLSARWVPLSTARFLIWLSRTAQSITIRTRQPSCGCFVASQMLFCPNSLGSSGHVASCRAHHWDMFSLSISLVPLSREHRRYFYVNDRTSVSQWDFPTKEEVQDEPTDGQTSNQGEANTTQTG